ncbi:hypothetical protein [Lactococcus lactis]|uniref:hypothetical protein n=1 Tax=Lactococcus lactis TaxID=1358 RepID=UPI00300DD4DD
MKLSEIKAHVYLKKAVEPKLSRVFQEPEEIKFIDYPVYTAEQMQEYAKECVREAYKEVVKNSYVSDDRVEQAGLNEIINKVFEEDTKND